MSVRILAPDGALLAEAPSLFKDAVASAAGTAVVAEVRMSKRLWKRYGRYQNGRSRRAGQPVVSKRRLTRIAGKLSHQTIRIWLGGCPVAPTDTLTVAL